MECATAPFLCIDVQVDAFMADRRLFRSLQPPGDLLGTPFLAQELLDQLPSVPSDPRTIGFALPVVGKFICLMRAIALLPAVAPQLARDGALMANEQGGDGGLVVAGFLQNVYLVSLFSGKLFIVHVCFF